MEGGIGGWSGKGTEEGEGEKGWETERVGEGRGGGREAKKGHLE